MSSASEIKIPNNVFRAVFGNLDANAIRIEHAFNVAIHTRSDCIKIVANGECGNVALAKEVFRQLIQRAQAGDEIDEQVVNYTISAIEDSTKSDVTQTVAKKLSETVICNSASGRPIKPKTKGQANYIDLIRKNIVTIGVGPAGTGKTYLAMAMAITAFRAGDVNRIILTRPAIEAGENLGFLPGDLQQKVDPYLRPLYDALNEIMGEDAFKRNLERNLIEVAPLAYMRGRTLNNAFIILDEAQNTTPEQMKMFLTRIGKDSKIVVTGDMTQIDLPNGKMSGLGDATTTLEDVEGIGIARLDSLDVVRHPMVQSIIDAYDRMDALAESANAIILDAG